MPSSNRYLDEIGANHLIEKIKTGFVTKEEYAGAVSFYNAVPLAHPYGQSGTSTTVSRGNHTHAYIPIAGNGASNARPGGYPTSGTILMGNSQSLSAVNSNTATNIVNLMSLNSDNELVIGQTATGMTDTDIYGGSNRRVTSDSILIRSSSSTDNLGRNGLFFENTPLWIGDTTGEYKPDPYKPSRWNNMIKAMYVRSNGGIEDLVIGNGTDHQRTYLYGGTMNLVSMSANLEMRNTANTLTLTALNFEIVRPTEGATRPTNVDGTRSTYVNIDTGNINKYLLERLPTVTDELFKNIQAVVTFYNNTTTMEGITYPNANTPYPITYVKRFPGNSSFNTALSWNDNFGINGANPQLFINWPANESVTGIGDLNTTLVKEALIEREGNGWYAQTSGDTITSYASSHKNYYLLPDDPTVINVRESGIYSIELIARGLVNNGNPASLFVIMYRKTRPAGGGSPEYTEIARFTLTYPSGFYTPMYASYTLTRAIHVRDTDTHTGICCKIMAYSPMTQTVTVDHLAITMARLNYIF